MLPDNGRASSSLAKKSLSRFRTQQACCLSSADRKKIKRHFIELLDYFRQRITNAKAEGFNSRIQSIKSAARSFRAFETTARASGITAESFSSPLTGSATKSREEPTTQIDVTTKSEVERRSGAEAGPSAHAKMARLYPYALTACGRR